MKRLAALFALSAQFAFAEAPATNKKGGASPVAGRFQLIQLSDFRRDQYLLDTETGSIWQPVCTKLSSDGTSCEGPPFFQRVVVEGLNDLPGQPVPRADIPQSH